jgi:hypothetical protein
MNRMMANRMVFQHTEAAKNLQRERNSANGSAPIDRERGHFEISAVDLRSVEWSQYGHEST